MISASQASRRTASVVTTAPAGVRPAPRTAPASASKPIVTTSCVCAIPGRVGGPDRAR